MMKNIFDLTGKTVLVTGSSRGIGRATALELGRNGATIIFHATALNQALHDTMEQASAEGLACRYVTGDLGKRDDVDKIIAEAGSPDAVVLNASVQKYMTLVDFEPDEFMRTFKVNLLSCISMVKAFLPAMQARKWGRFIAIGSVNQVRPAARLFTYAASKAALSNFMRGCAQTYASEGVTFNTVVPGVIATDRNRDALSDPALVKLLKERIPEKSFGEAADLAGIILLLVSEAGRYINGADIPVDGGMLL